MTARLSNAIEVLEHLQGDCTEHSILFIGLARAAGIPAREVAGLVYVDDLNPGSSSTSGPRYGWESGFDMTRPSTSPWPM